MVWSARQRGWRKGANMSRISVAGPYLAGNEKKYVLDAIESTWISSNGKYIVQFEQMFAEFCGVKHAVATNNGTTALHLALVALGVQPGDEVLIPTVTYIATANAVRYCGATPVLVDSFPGTLTMDPADAAKKITKRTKGIMPVHLYGHPADMQRLNQLAREHGLWVLEDAAEAHGAECEGARVGGLGTCAAFSFFGNKIVTTGEGGMVTTNDDELAAKLRLYRGQGMDPRRRYWFTVVGYNYRMTNVTAALGVAQMETIDRSIAERDEIAIKYAEALRPLADHILLPAGEPWARPVCWMYTIYLKNGGKAERDQVMRLLDMDDIETRPVFHPMHVMPPYRNAQTYPVADTWACRGINLPTMQGLTDESIQRVAASLKTALHAL